MKRHLLIIFVFVFQISMQSQTSHEEKKFKKGIQKITQQIDKHTKACGLNLYDSLTSIQVYFYDAKEFSLRVSVQDKRSNVYRQIYFFKENPIYEEIANKESKVIIYYDLGELKYFEDGQGNKSPAQNILLDKKSEQARIELLKSRIKSNFY